LQEVDVGSANPYTILIDNNHALHAVFVHINYTLTIIPPANGTTNPSPGSYVYDAGTSVSVAAIPDTGYMLGHWELDGANIGATNPVSVTMDANHTLYGVVCSLTENHDVALTNLTPSKTVVGRGYCTSINITVANQGDYTETFNVTVFAGASVINQSQLNLTSKVSTSIVFSWNTTDFVYDDYTVQACAQAVQGELDLLDNNCTSDIIRVTIRGDVHGNWKVDMGDIVALCKAFGSVPGKTNWVANLDIDDNAQIDMGDIIIAVSNFGQHYP
jgi:hypothetical protein